MELLKAEVESKAGEPTDAEVQELYEANARRLGGQPLEAVRDQVVGAVRQRKQQENIDWLNAQAPRPATWTIGKELGELPLAIGIVNAITKHGPRKEIQ